MGRNPRSACGGFWWWFFFSLRFNGAMPSAIFDGALAQAAQGGCGVSFSGDIPAPLAAVLCPLRWVTLRGQGVGLGDPRGPSQPRPVCDSVVLRLFLRCIYSLREGIVTQSQPCSAVISKLRVSICRTTTARLRAPDLPPGVWRWVIPGHETHSSSLFSVAGWEFQPAWLLEPPRSMRSNFPASWR